MRILSLKKHDFTTTKKLSQSCFAGAEDLRRVLQLLLLRAHQGDFEFEGFEESIELVIGGCSIFFLTSIFRMKIAAPVLDHADTLPM